MKKIDGKKLKEIMANKNVNIVDIGKESDFQKNHIMGSSNIPRTTRDFVGQVEKKFSKKNQEIVLCSTPESESHLKQLSKELEQVGYDNVYQYSADPKDWKSADLNVKRML